MLQGTRPMACPHVIALAQVLKRAAHKVKGEVAVTAGFVPFKVPVPPLLRKLCFPLL